MKIIHLNEEKSILKLLRNTVFAIAIIIVFVFAIYQASMYAIEYVKENIYSTRGSIDTAQEKHVLNGLYVYNAIFDLNETSHQKYIEMTLSNEDDYKVEFVNSENSYYIIIGTQNTSNTKFLYLIPEYIREEGFDQIVISALRGDDELYVSDVKLHDDVDTSEFTDYDIVDFEIKIIDIEIEDTYLKEIAQHRADAYKRRRILAEDTEYYTAVFSSGGETAEVEMRLKGGYTDHVSGYKWSFKFSFDDDYFFGMKKFAIHKPISRNGVYEYIMHTMYKEQGGVGLTYDFVQVVINGEYWGVYALEQSGDRLVTENSDHVEGAILTYERLYKNLRSVYYTDTMFSNEYITYIKAYSAQRTVSDENLYQYAQYAADAFDLALEGDIDLEEIIDYEMFAKYLAMCELFQGNHGLNLSNLWIYINPITMKIEPVSHDMLAQYVSYIPTTAYRSNSLIRNLFDDTEFMNMYIEYLEEYLYSYESFLDEHSEEIDNYTYLLQLDYCKEFDYYNGLTEHHQFIAETLYTEDAVFTLENSSNGGYILHVDSNSVISVNVKEILIDGEPIDIEFNSRQINISIDEEYIDITKDIQVVFVPMNTENAEEITKDIDITEALQQ